MKYILAVSGGVDSRVLLDMMSKNVDDELIVAHFDHGIRPDSYEDLEFVRSLADKYGLKFESKSENLGASASEELSRKRRYKFLRFIADKYRAKIVTAHHMDDALETIAINLKRGTGWRGLAVLDSSDVYRPLLDKSKSELIEYAKKHKLTWREDSTNKDDKYLRNRIRYKMESLDIDDKDQLIALFKTQLDIKKQIDELVNEILSSLSSPYKRKQFNDLSEPVYLELMRALTEAKLTRPQMLRVKQAIKTMLPAKIMQAGAGIEIKFTTRNFTISLLK